MNNTTHIDFLGLLDLHKVTIPMIQRDYAQGRDSEEEKRNNFLDSIKDHLDTNRFLDLNFIYGRVDETIETFYPIDGQQRLTTLFLLHWYSSLKDTWDSDKKKILLKFAYDTRISSREFCASIVNESIQIPDEVGEDEFIIWIKDQHWYRKNWDNDPTISAMLTMIQAIHDKFHDYGSEEIRKKIQDDKLIGFQLLDLGREGFELTDELYIKMNSRGKQLTPFENFKASFIGFIDKTYKDKELEHPVRGMISYSGYFSYRIEKEWTDLFWSYRNEDTTIDKQFSNYFEFITQCCFFASKIDAKADDYKGSFKQYAEVYDKEENFLFLVNTLDRLHLIAKTASEVFNNLKLDDFFNDFLSSIDTYNDGDKIHINWIDNGSNDLFERVLLTGRNEDARTKILFFTILKFCVKYDVDKSNESLGKMSRIIKNLLQQTRQRNETKYNTNVRINDFGSYWKLLNQLIEEDPYETLVNGNIDNVQTKISDDALKHEVEKVKLCVESSVQQSAIIFIENHKYLGGLLHQLDVTANAGEMEKFSNALHEIWSDELSDTIIIQALITCGFEGLDIRSTSMGQTKYFGKIDNWETILTFNDADISESLIHLLKEYDAKSGSPEDRLKAIIEDWKIQNNHDRSWKHYFICYSDFTSLDNYYVFNNDFEIRMLGGQSSNPLLAYHFSPYVLTVCKKLNDEKVCKLNDCKAQYTNNYPLVLKKGIYLKSLARGWDVEDFNKKIDAETMSKYDLIDEDEMLTLKETDSQDRVEIALSFINDLKK
jgi:hypothetical protein